MVILILDLSLTINSFVRMTVAISIFGGSTCLMSAKYVMPSWNTLVSQKNATCVHNIQSKLTMQSYQDSRNRDFDRNASTNLLFEKLAISRSGPWGWDQGGSGKGLGF